MGKSSKKAEAAAPVAVVPTKPLKKGKREAEESVEKAVVKKQKKIVVEEPIKKKVPEVKKKIEESSSEDDSSSDEDVKAPAAKAAPPAKNGTVKKGKQSSSSSSSEESDDSEDEAPKSKAATKNVPAAAKADSSSEDSSSEDDDVPAPAAKSGKPDIKKKESSSDESSDSDSDTPAKTIPKKPSATVNKKVEESSDDSSEEDSEDDKPQKKTKVEPAVAVKSKPDSDSEDASSDESSDDEDAKAPVVKKAAVAKSSSDESSEDESSDEEEPSKTPLKKSADVEMVDAYPSTKKEPKTPSTQSSGSKTLFVGNLPFTVEKSDVEGFFQECGEVVDVRFATHPDGAFKGFGHVEFATSEAAQKALKDLNGGDLMGRELRLDLANERGAFTPQSGEGASFQKFTAYVRGLDNSADENDIKTALREHFQECGEITRISVPTGDNGVKGFAYLDFTSKDALNKAFELNNTNVGDYPVTVEEARPREPRDNSGPPSRFNSNSRSHGRFNNSRGRSDNGGRFGNSRGRSGRSDRGRGGFSKPNLATPGTGKKTTFDD